MLRLKNVEYLHEWQWHQESNKCDSSDIEKRSEMHDVHKYRWNIYSIYNEVIESDHDDKYSKCNKNDEIKALNDEYIHR